MANSSQLSLAQQHRARGFEPCHGSAVVGRPVALKNFRARRRWRALHHQHVLDAHGNAGQRRQRIAFRGQCVDARGLRQRALFGEAQVDVQPRIVLLDALVVAGGQVGSLRAAARDLRAQRGQRLRLLDVVFGCFDFAGQECLSVPYSLFPVPCSLFPVPCSLFPVPCSLFPVPCSLFPVPCSLFPVPCSLFPVPCSLFPVPCSLFPVPCSLFPISQSPLAL